MPNQLTLLLLPNSAKGRKKDTIAIGKILKASKYSLVIHQLRNFFAPLK
jgi:hypothetical protein